MQQHQKWEFSLKDGVQATLAEKFDRGYRYCVIFNDVAQGEHYLKVWRSYPERDPRAAIFSRPFSSAFFARQDLALDFLTLASHTAINCVLQISAAPQANGKSTKTYYIEPLVRAETHPRLAAS